MLLGLSVGDTIHRIIETLALLNYVTHHNEIHLEIPLSQNYSVAERRMRTKISGKNTPSPAHRLLLRL